MEKKWKIKKEFNLQEIFQIKKKLADLGLPISLQLLKLLWLRGIKSAEEIKIFLDFDYEKNVTNPFLFSEMEKAVQRIILAKEKDERIAIFGDYDADGVTATALIFEVLKNLGFKDVLYYIPDRQIEGYGMNQEALEYLRRENVKLIITVDCGITNIQEVEWAYKSGLEVIITDHHHVPDIVPNALAIINPQAKNSGYPFKELSGVGVAFKLAQALYQRIKPEEIEQLKWFLDLVAIGTIADCTPLIGENRVLVKYGLLVLSKTRRIGLQEMFKVGKIAINENNVPKVYQVSFQLAPRINAAGRMDHANVSYKLIIENNRVKAREMALELESKNQERQKLTAEIVREIKLIAENSFKDKKIIFVSNPHWPVGVLGLVAGKICEEFGKPTAVFQKQDNELIGSLRSNRYFNVIENLEKCKKLLIRFGGHAQAAGAKVSLDKSEAFYQCLSALAEQELSGIETTPEIDIDLEIKPQDINWEFILEIKKMEPFGQGNEEPIFLMKDLEIIEIKQVGNGNKHLKMMLRGKNGSPKIFNAIGFGLGNGFLNLKTGDIIDIVFHLQEDEWNGHKKLQLKLIDLKPNG